MMTVSTIILTTTVHVHDVSFLHEIDSNSRIQTYLKSIKKWLYETDFKIVLVENSGYNFEELIIEKDKFKSRFEFICFNEKELPEASYLQSYKYGKGRHELFAINYAYNNSKLLEDSKFIIKVTGRFYIPELESFLRYYNLEKYDCLTQNNPGRCEMVGSNVKNFTKIFSIYNIFTENVEDVFLTRTSNCKNILKCKLFNIDETQRGGDNSTFKTI